MNCLRDKTKKKRTGKEGLMEKIILLIGYHQFCPLSHKLRNHNGLSKERKMKFIDDFFKI